mmetsp:Transcript_46341/g.110329  ORF Transcript_46341/g.110329 Transcript_46341/m.110329 type:complete len:854 (-) Transcript_46341:6-2567(-)|eukprot:CAMPEP_0178404504 /NCGR_PEP_ID=MMETSP0689_2-20121128/17920_1 /TAXON_ID=160604 /ORGANISM="Amphidinium massartii, Strain CS-259" /LENGTH=853 /DNA_ID=CAMNT_0020025495 /DNA_START=60 /DNA_END=2618 /DNA_ORIENTATION=+
MAPLSVDPYGDYLSRARWNIHGAGDAVAVEHCDENEATGARLVSEVAATFGERYQYTISSLGLHDGAYHYSCTFSCPSQERPVPGKVLLTKFALVGDLKTEAHPRLFYSFEEGDLRYEWELEQDSKTGRWHATATQQVVALGLRSVESFMDRLVADKETVGEWGVSLVTHAEETRLPPPPSYLEDEATDASRVSQADNAADGEGEDRMGSKVSTGSGKLPPDMQNAMLRALKEAGIACEKVVPPSSIAELLENVFDAADEENHGDLTHLEVARLLGAILPGFALEEWDIHQLLALASETEDGKILCQPLVQEAPEIVEALRARRLAFQARGLPGVEVPLESVKFCFSAEALETTAFFMRFVEQTVADEQDRARWKVVVPQVLGLQDPNAPEKLAGEHLLPVVKSEAEDLQLVSLKRRWAVECLRGVPERLSPQEVERLMQMLSEDEDGYVFMEDFVERLELLRMQALLNSMIESDLNSLRTQLVQSFRRVGMQEDGQMKLWDLKHGLLQVSQVCLGRLQIHALLCMAEPSSDGMVDVEAFLATCCVAIPHMFDAKAFVAWSERLQLEHAEAHRRAENAELAAFAAATVIQAQQEEEHEEEGLDVEQVEKLLIQAIALCDDTHKNPACVNPEVAYGVLLGSDINVQTCQFSRMELIGLAAEMLPDLNGQVIYGDFIRKWVSTIYEMRKHLLLSAYLEETWMTDLGLQRLAVEDLQKICPYLPPSELARTGSILTKNSRTGSELNQPRARRQTSKDIRSGSKLSMRTQSQDSLPGDGEGSHNVAHFRQSYEEDDHDLGGRTSSMNVGQTAKAFRKSQVERTGRGRQSSIMVSRETPHGRGFARRKQLLASTEEKK